MPPSAQGNRQYSAYRLPQSDRPDKVAAILTRRTLGRGVGQESTKTQGDGLTEMDIRRNPASLTHRSPVLLSRSGTDVDRRWENAPWGVRESNSPQP